jgi:Arc/MetJ family transcription regulator
MHTILVLSYASSEESMRTTLNLREDLLKEAMKLTDQKEKTAVIHMALEALIEKAARQDLISFGGKFPGFKKVRRKR